MDPRFDSGLPINFGQPSAEQVIGREAEIAEITRAIERGSSVILTGERRIGKSWVLQTLVAEPPEGWVGVYTDVEQISDLAALRDVLSERITQRLPRARRAIERGLHLDVKEIKGVPLPKPRQLAPVDQLRRLIRAAAGTGRKIILVLDELPILAQQLEARVEGEALILLRLLRALRMEEPNVRLVLAGSIGFHHLLAEDAEIKAAVNDLLPVPIGPLSFPDACTLAGRLLVGIGQSRGLEGLAVEIVNATDGVPFYIQHLVNDLERRMADCELTPEVAQQTRRRALSSPDDPWRMRHYDERLEDYFGNLAPLARAILDAIAWSDDGLAFDGIMDRVRTNRSLERRMTFVEDDVVRDVITRLSLDHYVVIDPVDRRMRWCFPVVRDAWRAMRLP